MKKPRKRLKYFWYSVVKKANSKISVVFFNILQFFWLNLLVMISIKKKRKKLIILKDLTLNLHMSGLCFFLLIYLFQYEYDKYITFLSSCFNHVSMKTSYLYLYIYCHPQTGCFVLSELFSVARHVGRLSWDRNPPNFTLDLVLDHSANKHTMSARES